MDTIKYYIAKEGNHIDITMTSDEITDNIGYDKIDFENGCYIEISEEQVEDAQNLAYHSRVYDCLFPTKYYYAKNGVVLDFPRALNDKIFKVGSDINDPSSYVLLTDEQVHYYLHHRDADIKDIINN